MSSLYEDNSRANELGTPLARGGGRPSYYQPPLNPYADYYGYDSGRPLSQQQPQYHRKKSHFAKWAVGGAIVAGLIVAAIFTIKKRYRGTTIAIIPVVNGNAPKKMTMFQVGPPGATPHMDGTALPIDYITLAPIPRVYHLNGSPTSPSTANGSLFFGRPSTANTAGSNASGINQSQARMDATISTTGTPTADFLQVNGGGMPEPMVDTSFMDNIVSRTHG